MKVDAIRRIFKGLAHSGKEKRKPGNPASASSKGIYETPDFTREGVISKFLVRKQT